MNTHALGLEPLGRGGDLIVGRLGGAGGRLGGSLLERVVGGRLRVGGEAVRRTITTAAGAWMERTPGTRAANVGIVVMLRGAWWRGGRWNGCG